MNYRDMLMSSSSVWNDLMERPTPLVRNTLITGSDAGFLKVPDIKAGDELVSVINLSDNKDITVEFKKNDTFENLNARDGYINNTYGKSTVGDSLLVSWLAWVG